MIRISTSARQEAWHEIDIDIDGEAAPMRVRYWLLSRAEASALNRRRFQASLAAKNAATSEDQALAVIDYLIDKLSPEQIEAAEALLRARILDWDLQDADSESGATLPVTEQTLGVILDQARFFEPLYVGLIDASLAAVSKKTGSSG